MKTVEVALSSAGLCYCSQNRLTHELAGKVHKKPDNSAINQLVRMIVLEGDQVKKQTPRKNREL